MAGSAHLSPKTGAVLSYILQNSQEWKYRKVDSIRLLEGRSGRRKLSIDMVPPEHPALAYDPQERALQKPGNVKGPRMIPLARIKKGELRDFDIRVESGEPVPVLGKSENADLAASAILYELGGKDAFGHPGLVKAVRAITAGEPTQAQEVSNELLEHGTYRGAVVADPSQFTDQAVFFIDRFTIEFLLIALLPAQLCGKRTVIKYSFHWEAQLETISDAIPLLTAAARFQQLGLAVELSSPDEAASYHLEVHAPDGVVCLGLLLPGQIQASSPQSLPHSPIAHSVGSFPQPPEDSAVLLLGVPTDGMHLMALMVSIFTAAVFWTDRLMPGAHEAWLEASGEAVAILLALPAAVLALLARPGENFLSRKILFPLRATVLTSCLLLVTAGASFVGKLNEPFMSWFWWIGMATTTFASLALLAGRIPGVGGYSSTNNQEQEGLHESTEAD